MRKLIARVQSTAAIAESEGSADETSRSRTFRIPGVARWVTALLILGGLGFGEGGVVAASPCWDAPVDGVVSDPFRAPDCRWCPGNRGIEFSLDRRATVRSAATGRVTFSGTVVDTRYVVVQMASGWKITYGRLDSTRLKAGDVVVAGVPVGVVTGEFFFGLRIDGEYVDPSPYLGRRIGRPRLIPSTGGVARPAPPSRLRCGAVGFATSPR